MWIQVGEKIEGSAGTTAEGGSMRAIHLEKHALLSHLHVGC
jgi:hypothetical protein